MPCADPGGAGASHWAGTGRRTQGTMGSPQPPSFLCCQAPARRVESQEVISERRFFVLHMCRGGQEFA